LSESPNELTVRAAAEYLCTEHGSLLAFPSIVASGVHATTLHHQPVNHTIKSGELVVVDIGAKYEGYCADISRTYPVIGKFSERQRQLYEIVLSVQEAVAEAACPGMFLKNPDLPDKSLHHIACAVFKEYGLESAFIHNIGHYLGLDVHDVGSYAEPLAEGDVITIEPGVYLPNEGIGVRIEDNFWVVPGGAVCLSDSLVRSVDDIEALCSEILRS
jgi:Xaa-Pro aminopeptidase